MATYYVDGAVGSDSNAGTSPGAGNAFATIGKAESLVAAGDKVNIKSSAPYVLTSKITLAASGNSTSGDIEWIGYQTTPGDMGTPPTITSSTSGLALVEMNGENFRRFKNLKFTHTGATRGIAFDAAATASFSGIWEDCIFNGVLCAAKFDNLGAEFSGSGTWIRNYITNCTGPALRIIGGVLVDCAIIGNLSDGVLLGSSSTNGGPISIQGTVIAANGGKGINGNSSSGMVLNVDRSTIADNTGDGIGSTAFLPGVLSSCLIYGNGGYGVNIPAIGAFSEKNCAYGSNTSGARNNLTAGPGAVTLTANPFSNSGAGDYSLNSTAGGGAACRGAGYPGAFPNGTTTGYSDIGAVQHQDAGGGGGLLIHPGMRGRMHG